MLPISLWCPSLPLLAPLVPLEMYGAGGGTYFSTSSDCEITGVRVAVDLIGLVKR